jgi:hypothetical protein
MYEKQIKEALTSHLDRYRRNKTTSAYLEEVQINGGLVRADLVDVRSMHCYEIKSDLDTLKRLHSQGSRYGKVFDNVTLVTSERHLARAMTMVPTWWGIMLIPAPGNCVFSRIKYGRANHNVDRYTLVTLLDKQEVLDVMDRHGKARGWKSKSLYILQQRLADMIPISCLKTEVQACLFRRINHFYC